MTRVLAELLGTSEPSFRLGLRQLENASGAPAHDIRLSSEVQQVVQEKLKELGLDPHDTTGEELYAALGTRLKQDEKQLRQSLRQYGGGSEDPLEQVVKALSTVDLPKATFALKQTVAKRLFKAAEPKRTMKTLGYRSLDSMLKHEPISALYAAAWLTETEAWQKRLIGKYSKLKPSDFERRDIAFEHPTTERWQKMSTSVMAARKHHVLAFKELGSVVLLPITQKRPELFSLTTLVLSVHALNEIHAAGIYLQLHQVKAQFGKLVQSVVVDTPIIDSKLLDMTVPWPLAHRYYARHADTIRTDIFEPHVQLQDIKWHPVETVLSKLAPSLEFWHGSGHAALLHKGEAVSCNITDALLSHCNKLPFAKRISSYFEESLWHELFLRYLNHETLEKSLADSLELEQVSITA